MEEKQQNPTPKKKLVKKWWFWVIIGVTISILGIIGIITGGVASSSIELPENTNSNSTKTTTEVYGWKDKVVVGQLEYELTNAVVTQKIGSDISNNIYVIISMNIKNNSTSSKK